MSDEVVNDEVTPEETAPEVAPEEVKPEEAAEQGTPEEGKPEDGKPAEGVKEGAPETYEDFTMPEGVEVDAALMEQFQPIAKDLGLSQEQAQKLVDLQTKNLLEQSKADAERWDQLHDEWTSAARNDAEFGGAKFEESLGLAITVLEKYGTPELREALDVTGTGDHPELIRLLVRVGKDLSEDKLIGGAKPNNDRPPIENRMFPNQN